jgi:hypothetical protein
VGVQTESFLCVALSAPRQQDEFFLFIIVLLFSPLVEEEVPFANINGFATSIN